MPDPGFSPQLAQEIEDALLRILTRFDTVSDGHEAHHHSDRFMYYKVVFKSSQAENPAMDSFFLQFKPEDQEVVGWSGNGSPYPKDVLKFLRTQLRGHFYEETASALKNSEGFHHWYFVNLQQLQQVANT